MKKIKYLLLALLSLALSNDLYAQYFIGGGLVPKTYDHKISGNGINKNISLSGVGLEFSGGYYLPFLRLHFDLDTVGVQKNKDKASATEAGAFVDYYQFVNENIMLYSGAGLSRLSLSYKKAISSPITKVSGFGVIGDLGFIYRLSPVDLGLSAKFSLIPYNDKQKGYKSKIKSISFIGLFANYAF